MTKYTPKTTVERLREDPGFAKELDKQYRELVLSELLLAIMDNDQQSVRKLAKEVGISPTVIQNIRSGKQFDIKLGNFVNIAHACGYQLYLEKGKERIPL